MGNRASYEMIQVIQFEIKRLISAIVIEACVMRTFKRMYYENCVHGETVCLC